MEKEDQSRKLNFLDVTIINTGVRKYEFKINRKNAITNVQIKPHSYVNPALIRDIFKGFVSRGKNLCSEKYLDDELNFLVDIFIENEHGRNHLYSIITENNHQTPKTENTDSNIDKLPLIPIIGPKIRNELRKTRCRVIFTSATKLKNVLCNNKSKLLPNSYPCVYELSCDCVGANTMEKQKKNACSLDQLNMKKIVWQENGKRPAQLKIPKIAMHHPKTIAKLSNIHERKVRESLEISNLETKAAYEKSIKVLNRDRGNIVNTNSWRPLFRKINMERHANAMK